MSRLAGNKPHYEIALLDAEGNPTSHRFDFTSVTTVLDAISKPYLYGWYYSETVNAFSELLEKYRDKVSPDIDKLKAAINTHKLGPFQKRNAAGREGTALHKTLEELVEGKRLMPTPRNVGLLDWWEDLRDGSSRVLASEEPLVSFAHRIAGTVDLAVLNETGYTTLLDLKSGSKIDWTSFLQVQAYKMMWNEMGKEPECNDVMILHCPKEGGYKLKRAEDITEEAFLQVLKLYRMKPPKYWRPEEGEL